MKKDKMVSARVNSLQLNILKNSGWTVQKLFDWALSQLIEVKTTIKKRKQEK